MDEISPLRFASVEMTNETTHQVNSEEVKRIETSRLRSR